ncbi:hypothetical protein [Paraflavitalea pollutisoli]|uniref:hypothetical protein n=1 Tax=Paraflavitalea pollutisoli TaxID=3034143 RepID=UPI0023EB4C11|nr:hypothetical protein [Paraflavitalea sp. H1-2-19X]
MTLEQRSQYPDIRFVKPPVRKSPTDTQLQEWTNNTKYGIWLDGKHIENQALVKYKGDDIALFSSSRLYGKALKAGKHTVQIDLSTNEWYNKNYAEDTELMVVIELTSHTPAPSK